MLKFSVHNPRGVIKIDCAEFQHSHEIAKLVGSPPGYLGHRETHPMLSQESVNAYQSDTCRLSFILFDEIEKANDALWNLLLGILDKATLTLGDNRRVDFSRAMIFMTSNLGAKEMSTLVNSKIGFQGVVMEGVELNEKVANTGLAAARKKFTPEFMNRIDKVVVFEALGEAELRIILDLELNHVQNRILLSPLERPFVLSVSDPAKDLLLMEGTDLHYGARPLKRAIERLITQPLSRLLSTSQIENSDYVRVERDGDRLVFRRMPS